MTTCSDWKAWYDERGELHVTGTCTLDSSSNTLELEPGNEGIVDNPQLFVLRLVEHRPEVGDTSLAERAVEWTGAVEAGITTVQVRGAAEATISVTLRGAHG